MQRAKKLTNRPLLVEEERDKFGQTHGESNNGREERPGRGDTQNREHGYTGPRIPTEGVLEELGELAAAVGHVGRL